MKDNITLSIEEAQRLQDKIKVLKKENIGQAETIALLGDALNRVCGDKSHWKKAVLLVVNQRTKLLELPGLSVIEVRPINPNVDYRVHNAFPNATYFGENNNITACFEKIDLTDITDHCYLIDGDFYKVEYTNCNSVNLRTMQEVLKQYKEGDDENGESDGSMEPVQ